MAKLKLTVVLEDGRDGSIQDVVFTGKLAQELWAPLADRADALEYARLGI